MSMVASLSGWCSLQRRSTGAASGPCGGPSLFTVRPGVNPIATDQLVPADRFVPWTDNHPPAGQFVPPLDSHL